MDNRTLRKLKRIHRQLGKSTTDNFDSIEEMKSIVDIMQRLNHLIQEVEQNRK